MIQGEKLLDCHACNLDPLLLLDSGALLARHGEEDKGQALGPRVEQLVIEDWYRWLLHDSGKPLRSLWVRRFPRRERPVGGHCVFSKEGVSMLDDRGLRCS